MAHRRIFRKAMLGKNGIAGGKRVGLRRRFGIELRQRGGGRAVPAEEVGKFWTIAPGREVTKIGYGRGAEKVTDAGQHVGCLGLD